jgi:hypothetical protein
MTKKEFKRMISERDNADYHEYGNGRSIGLRAIFFDYKSNENGSGYKYMFCSTEMNKTELINLAYNWIIKENNPDWRCYYAYASEDKFRFKIPLNGSTLLSLQENISKKMLKETV